MMAHPDPERDLGRQILSLQAEASELDRRMRELIEEIQTRRRMLGEFGRRADELREALHGLVGVSIVSPWVTLG